MAQELAKAAASRFVGQAQHLRIWFKKVTQKKRHWQNEKGTKTCGPQLGFSF